METDQSLEDAVVIIQEASAAISKVSTTLQSEKKEVLSALKDLTEKVSQISNCPSHAEVSKPKPSLYIRNLVRGVYRDTVEIGHGSNQFVLTESFTGPNNQMVVDSIKREVKTRYSKATDSDIDAACFTYFRSRYQDHLRELNGKKEKHRRDQRRHGRKKQKLLSRRKQFQEGNFDWSTSRKERMKYILSKGLQYMSSEESGEDEEGKPVYYRKYLPWLKQKYRKSLRRLDNLYYASLSGKSKQMYRTHCDGEPSSKPPPVGVPDYLLSEKGQEDLNSSID